MTLSRFVDGLQQVNHPIKSLDVKRSPFWPGDLVCFSAKHFLNLNGATSNLMTLFDVAPGKVTIFMGSLISHHAAASTDMTARGTRSSHASAGAPMAAMGTCSVHASAGPHTGAIGTCSVHASTSAHMAARCARPIHVSTCASA